jgi:uncharacterized protein (TIGR02186 family)
MRRAAAAAWLALAAVAAGGPARAQELVVDLTDPVVAVTTGFVGAKLVLFGTTEGRGDIVVIVRGPAQDAVVRRKEKIAGIWINRAHAVFADVPAFYAVASNRPIDEFLPRNLADLHQIGVQSLDIDPHKTQEPRDDIGLFRNALVRNKQRDGLYSREIGNVTFLSPRLFRTAITFPANVPVGAYAVEVYLVRNREIAATQTTVLNVRKFGLEQGLYDFAHRHAAAYGLLAIVLAAVAGWLANVAFRRG